MKQKIQLKALDNQELVSLVLCLANLMTKQDYMSYIELFDWNGSEERQCPYTETIPDKVLPCGKYLALTMDNDTWAYSIVKERLPSIKDYYTLGDEEDYAEPVTFIFRLSEEYNKEKVISYDKV